MLIKCHLLWEILGLASQFLHKINIYIKLTVHWGFFLEFLHVHICQEWCIQASLTSIWESVFNPIKLFFRPSILREIPGPSSDLERKGCGPLDDDFCGQWPCRIILCLVWTQNISTCICTCGKEIGLVVKWCVLACLSTSFPSCPCVTELLFQWNLLHQDGILNRQWPKDSSLGSLPGQLEAGRGKKRLRE